MAARTVREVQLPRALDPRGRWISPASGTTGLCPDCGEKVTAIVSAYYRPHFRHTGPCVRNGTGSSGVSAEHRAAQWALIELFDGCDPRYETFNDAHTRRADLMITFHGQKIVVEVQRSNMSLADMESRTADWNAEGVAVLWVFTTSMLSIDNSGNAKLASTAYNWARRRGWQQCYLIDPRGTLWWVDLRPPRHVARPISRQMRSQGGLDALLVTDTNVVANASPLIVAAFAWRSTGRRVSPFGTSVQSWVPFGRDRTVADTTPDRI